MSSRFWKTMAFAAILLSFVASPGVVCARSRLSHGSGKSRMTHGTSKSRMTHGHARSKMVHSQPHQSSFGSESNRSSAVPSKKTKK